MNTMITITAIIAIIALTAESRTIIKFRMTRDLIRDIRTTTKLQQLQQLQRLQQLPGLEQQSGIADNTKLPQIGKIMYQSFYINISESG